MLTIGVLGAGGAVGGRVAAMLAGPGMDLRLGARRPSTVDAPAGATVVPVDAAEPDDLRRFADGCDVVVNCTGPSHRFSPVVADAAVTAGAGYVDAGGDEALRLRLADAPVPVVLGAGQSPGLSGLLPRWLARQADGPVRALRTWGGGLERFTPAAAADMVASVHDSYGLALAAWRDGAVVERAATPLTDVELVPFPGRVTAYPFLTGEARRVAAAVGARDGDFYNVFGGAQTFAVLSRLRAEPGLDADAAAARLVRAADVDLAGRRPYQLMVVEVDGDRPLTLTLRADDGYRLTATVAALAATAVRDGRVPAGAGWADELLDVDEVTSRVAGVCTVFEVTEGLRDSAVEEVFL